MSQKIYWADSALDKSSIVYIFVHGFGVKWHSKQLFSDISDKLLAHGYQSAMFNLSDYDDVGNSYLLPLPVQQNRLRDIIVDVKLKYPQSKYVIVGHSLGCGVISSAIDSQIIEPEDYRKIIFLAPAMLAPGQRIYQHLKSSKDLREDDSHNFEFDRKDGTKTHFSIDYVHSLEQPFIDIYQKVWPSIANKIKVITAEKDFVVPDQDQLLAKFDHTQVPEADHNFTHHRQEVADLVFTSSEDQSQAQPSS